MMDHENEALLAIDIGASSGRHIVRVYTEGGSEDVEVYRFENRMNTEDGHLVWDVRGIWEQIKAGIAVACRRFPGIRSVGIDTWGVDYVLLKGEEEILPAYAYRDSRTRSACRDVAKLYSDAALYARTGCQFQPFNTIYQLMVDKVWGRLEEATDFLMLPEYFYWKLTGVKLHEYTNATTTGLVDALKKAYDPALVSALGLPARLFGELTFPGRSDPLLPAVREELGFRGEAVLVATHDTASAVEGIDMPLNSLYVSSGTWCLLGVKSEHPILREDAREQNFSNEGGIGYYRFQKNIMGLWIVQRLKEEMGFDSFEEMVRLAESSDYRGIFDVNDEGLLSPASMKDEVLRLLANAGQRPPKAPADLLNAVYRSLAFSYHLTIREMERLTGLAFDGIHVFGGGAKNGYLNRLIESATGKTVFVHSVEATALGNLKVQELARTRPQGSRSI